MTLSNWKAQEALRSLHGIMVNVDAVSAGIDTGNGVTYHLVGGYTPDPERQRMMFAFQVSGTAHARRIVKVFRLTELTEQREFSAPLT